MNLIIKQIDHDLDIKKYFNKKSCFMDIETTGFNRSKDIIYLIGIIYYDSTVHSWVLEQYFAPKPDKEKDILIKFIDAMDSFDNIITYNGDAFDIPFINNKLTMYNTDKKFDMDTSTDLYRVVRQNRDFLNLENMKLKTVEESLGYYREDIYSGYDCIQFYREFVVTGDTNLKDNILKHNNDDLVHMLDIIKIIDVIEDKKTVTVDKYRFLIGGLSINGDKLLATGSISPKLEFNIGNYSEYYNLITKDKDKFEISIDIKEGMITKDKKSHFINLNNFNLSINSSNINIKYSLPDNIFILFIENKPVIHNIKILLKLFLSNHI